MPKNVAVIGGGYAGMACAVELVDGGLSVVVFEAGRVLGGRARRVDVHGIEVDNGQHLLVGGYSELLRLTEKTRGSLDGAIERRPLELLIEKGARLRLPRVPAPLDSAIGLLFARGLSLADKWAAVRLIEYLKKRRFRLELDCPLFAWLKQLSQPERLVRGLWEPLCLAALNTPIADASAQVFANVLRDSLLGPSGAADLIFPTVDLSRFFPEPAASYIEARQSRVHRGVRISEIEKTPNGWLVGAQLFDDVVLAVGPHHAEKLVRAFDSASANLCAALEYQPITTIWLQYDKSVRLPKPMLGFNGAAVQWLFDRGQLTGQDGLMAAVISTDGPHLDLTHDQLGQAVVRELHRRFGWGEQTQWTRVIIEKRATFACRYDTVRPQQATAEHGLWLAGDYIAGDYPATVEGAVRSGVSVARNILNKGRS